MTEPMSVLHLTGKDPSSGEIKTFDFEIVDEVARRQKADKADTVQETTLSRGRKEGTEVGEGSVAFGTDVEASGEGSHAEGNGTIANAPYMYAFGEYNTPAEILPEWVAGTEYAAGDKVIYDGKAYVCDTANSDAEFDPTKWTETDMPEAPAFVIGNGTSENSRGDAFAVERDGDVKAGGDLYTNYDPATGTGKKVATEDYVGDLIGDVVSMEYAVADELPATGEVGTIYLIPNGETSGTDTHDEYIWVPATESFEKIGNTKVDLSDYALKTDTVLNTTLSMGRKAGTTVGHNSTALGANVEASGDFSFATGNMTTASGDYSHAEGGGTQATGSASHAEGGTTQATGDSSHAEGGRSQATGSCAHAEGGNTLASGGNSHAQGIFTIANGNGMHAQGKYNKPDDTVYPDWVASKSYAVGDNVTYDGAGYTCKTANSDATFTSKKWTPKFSNGDVAFVIGNGTADNARSNAFTVKWDGSVQEGGGTTASGSVSHAEGGGTTASGSASHAEGGGTTASGSNSHAEGSGSRATGYCAHAEGGSTTASGDQSHAEGSSTLATNSSAHAEGTGTQATGSSSHAEGGGSQATGNQSHAEGGGSRATGSSSHAEGGGTLASGGSSHAEGGASQATGNASHAEGSGTIANGIAMHAQGMYNRPDDAAFPDWVASKSYAVGDKVLHQSNGYTCKTANSDATFTSSKWTKESSHVGEIAFVIGNGANSSNRSNAFVVKWDGSVQEGKNTTAKVQSHAEGINTTATGSASHAEGTETHATGHYSHAEGVSTTASGRQSHAEGYNTTASGENAHTEGQGTTASEATSHAEGNGTTASGNSSHAEGVNSSATATRSHAEGGYTVASGEDAHAEGRNTRASGYVSHAEGNNTVASGGYSHTEGSGTAASSEDAHAEGFYTQASGEHSHAEGSGTIANGIAMHAQGKWNKPDDSMWPWWVSNKSYQVGDKVQFSGYNYTCVTANSDATFDSSKWTNEGEASTGDIAFVIGNGTAENARSNAFAVKWDGTLIMRDVSNGAYYKVYIDGGVLKTEAVV